jgi:small subunit ribosomal protein S1
VNHPSEVLEIGQTVKVKVLDIDRERQRISLGLKQTQSDPWQQVLEQHKEGDVVEGKVTKVVTFGAFVEILPGVEGLVHISELAQHHVENPREVVSQGDTVPVLILEVDAERRRLSLSLKRVDADRRTENEPPIEGTPHLDLSEDVFTDSASAPPAPELEPKPVGEESVEREAEAVSAEEQVDPAAADEEATAPAETAADEHQ